MQHKLIHPHLTTGSRYESLGQVNGTTLMKRSDRREEFEHCSLSELNEGPSIDLLAPTYPLLMDDLLETRSEIIVLAHLATATQYAVSISCFLAPSAIINLPWYRRFEDRHFWVAFSCSGLAVCLSKIPCQDGSPPVYLGTCLTSVARYSSSSSAILHAWEYSFRATYTPGGYAWSPETLRTDVDHHSSPFFRHSFIPTTHLLLEHCVISAVLGHSLDGFDDAGCHSYLFFNHSSHLYHTSFFGAIRDYGGPWELDSYFWATIDTHSSPSFRYSFILCPSGHPWIFSRPTDNGECATTWWCV